MTRAARLLVVHHTVSPATEAMLESLLAGTRAEGLEGVAVVTRPALAASVSDVLNAGAIVLGSPANLGYLSGALKHFFDQVYYPVRRETVGLPFGAYLHANEGPDGAIRAIDTITTGLGWARMAANVVVAGPPTPADLDACWELGATLAAATLPA